MLAQKRSAQAAWQSLEVGEAVANAAEDAAWIERGIGFDRIEGARQDALVVLPGSPRQPRRDEQREEGGVPAAGAARRPHVRVDVKLYLGKAERLGVRRPQRRRRDPSQRSQHV